MTMFFYVNANYGSPEAFSFVVFQIKLPVLRTAN
jgi:hypothetical protein